MTVSLLESLFDASTIIIGFADAAGYTTPVACPMLSMTAWMGGGILMTLLVVRADGHPGLSLQMFVVYSLPR